VDSSDAYRSGRSIANDKDDAWLARQWQENTVAAVEAPEPYWQAAHLTWRAILALSGIMILVSLSVCVGDMEPGYRVVWRC